MWSYVFHLLVAELASSEVKDGVELDVARTLVDSADLAVTPELLDTLLASKALTTGPLDGETSGALRNLAREELGHGSLLGEGTALLLEAGSVVHHHAGSLDLSCDLAHLELQALELGNRAAELLALKGVADAALKRTLRETDHLGANTDTALVEDLNGNLVALAFLANEVLDRHLDLVKVDSAGATGADTELALLLGNLDAHVLGHGKGRDTLVALRGITLGEHNEELSLSRVGDPHLAAVDDVVLAIVRLLDVGLHGEGIRARRGLRKAERAQHAFREAGHVALTEVVVGVLAEHSVYKRVVHVTQHRNRGVDLGELYR